MREAYSPQYAGGRERPRADSGDARGHRLPVARQRLAVAAVMALHRAGELAAAPGPAIYV